MSAFKDLVHAAATEADRQFEGQDHVTAEQIAAAAGSVASRWLVQARLALDAEFVSQIRDAMKSKPRAPKGDKK